MGRHFAGSDLRVDRIVSSSAARAWSTARLFQEAFDPAVPLTSRRDLYHADEMDLLAVALEEAGDDEDARVMIVGHNPGMHDLALFLCGQGDPVQVGRLRWKFPTGALAEFALSVKPMGDVPAHSARLVRFVRPKDLPTAKELRL